MPPLPETVRLPLVEPLVVVRYCYKDAPPWVWDHMGSHPLLWARRRLAGDCIAALTKGGDISVLVMCDAVPMDCEIEVAHRYGVEVPLIPSSFFASWASEVPLLCPPFCDGRVIFSGEPAVCDLIDLADATNFATTYLD